MADLNELREKIDGIDKELTALLEKRFDTVLKIAEYKKKNDVSILNTDRERKVIDKNVALLSDKMYAPYVSEFYTALMNISKKLQSDTNAEKTAEKHVAVKPQSIAYQGVEGSYSYEALTDYFDIKGSEVKLVNYKNFEDVFAAVKNGEAECGIVPIENSSTGSIAENYDLLNKYDCYIKAEIIHNISHVLAAKNGASLESVKKIYSHTQGFEQCSEFLKDKDCIKVPYYNTAISAQYVSQQNDLSLAAISSRSAAEIYGLCVLKENISNNRRNYTRFIVISKDFEYREGNKISIVFYLDDKPGALASILSLYNEENINISKIESRPSKNSLWKYIFFMNFEGNFSDPKIKNILEKTNKLSAYMRILGNY